MLNFLRLDEKTEKQIQNYSVITKIRLGFETVDTHFLKCKTALSVSNTSEISSELVKPLGYSCSTTELFCSLLLWLFLCDLMTFWSAVLRVLSLSFVYLLLYIGFCFVTPWLRILKSELVTILNKNLPSRKEL